jgi:hypothetical protein
VFDFIDPFVLDGFSTRRKRYKLPSVVLLEELIFTVHSMFPSVHMRRLEGSIIGRWLCYGFSKCSEKRMRYTQGLEGR